MERPAVAVTAGDRATDVDRIAVQALANHDAALGPGIGAGAVAEDASGDRGVTGDFREGVTELV